MKKSPIELIADERDRQQGVLGWTKEHDKEHDGEELALAAACLALPPSHRRPCDPWPWLPKDRPIGVGITKEQRRRELIKAAALIVAELDRLES